jgi:hypothetical protein
MRRFIANAVALSAFAFLLPVNAQQNVFAPFGGTVQATFVGGSTGGNYNLQDNDNLFNFLSTSASTFGLPQPTENASDFLSGSPVEAGDYLVLYYNGPDSSVDIPGNSTVTLPGGITANGPLTVTLPGALDVLFFPNRVDSFNIPPQGENTALAPGPIIFARLFDHVPASIPDGGATAALLGIGLIGMGVLRRKAVQG